MRRLLDGTHVADMAASLENDELGAAVRILSRIIATGKAIPSSRARIVAQMGENAWAASQDAILEFFVQEGETISHAALREATTPAISATPKERAGQTADLPLVSTVRRNVVPTYVSREAPERISIKQAAYSTMVRLCSAVGQSENTARAMLASLLKTWPEGDVYNAVAQADRQDFVADPRSWITASLKRASQPTVRQPSHGNHVVPAPAAKKHKLATPEALGVSQGTADKIRQRNRALGLNLTTKGETA